MNERGFKEVSSSMTNAINMNEMCKGIILEFEKDGVHKVTKLFMYIRRTFIYNNIITPKNGIINKTRHPGLSLRYPE